MTPPSAVLATCDFGLVDTCSPTPPTPRGYTSLNTWSRCPRCKPRRLITAERARCKPRKLITSESARYKPRQLITAESARCKPRHLITAERILYATFIRGASDQGQHDTYIRPVEVGQCLPFFPPSNSIILHKHQPYTRKLSIHIS